MRSAGNFHPQWGYLAPAPSFMRTVRIAMVATAVGATAGAAVVVSLLGRSSDPNGNGSIAAHALVTSGPAAQPHAIAQASSASAASAQASASATLQKPQPIMQSRVSPQPGTMQSASVATQGTVRSDGNATAGSLSQPPAGAIQARAQVPPRSVKEAVRAPVRDERVAHADAARTLVRPPKVEEAAPASVRGERAAHVDAAGKHTVAKKRRRASYYPARRWRPAPTAAAPAANEADAAREARQEWHQDGGFGPLLNMFSFHSDSSSSSN
jgi:hypothetical protein